MKTFLGLGFFVLFISLIITGCAITNNSSPVKEKTVPIVAEFPEGYQDWPNIGAKVVLDKTSPFYGFQRVLVSDRALPTYKIGGEYPEGSQLVLEFNELIPEGQRGDVAKGGTNWIAVMRKDKAATETGGWVFAAFDGKKALKADIDPVKGCYACHTGQKNNNYVFSKYIP